MQQIDIWSAESLSAFASERISAVRAEMLATLRYIRPHPGMIVLWLALATGLAVITAFAAGAEYFSWDLWLAREVQAIDIEPLTRVLRFATYISSSDASIISFFLFVPALLLLRRYRLAFFAAASIWTHLIGGSLKLAVGRTRPSPELIERTSLEERLSYPSGHAEWIVGFEGFLVFALWQLTPNPYLRFGALGAWIAHIVFASVGRVDEGLHWPSDVLAGLIVGTLTLSITIWAYRASVRAAAIVERAAAEPDGSSR